MSDDKKAVSVRSMQLLKSFLKTHFESGWEIEMMCFLHKHNSECFTAAQLVQTFQIEHKKLQEVLTKMCQQGLLKANLETATYKFSPDTAEKNVLMDILVKAFFCKRLQVIRMLYE